MPGRVLIITYYWPPSGGAGVQRWLKFTKYLRQFGWEPVIYTPLNPEFPAIDDTLEKDIPDNIEIVKTPIWEPYQLFKKLTGKKSDEKVYASGFISEKGKSGILQKVSLWVRGNFFIPDARKYWIKPSVKFLLEWIPQNNIDAVVSTGPPHSMHLIALGLKEKLNLPWLADFRDPWTDIDFYKELNLTSIADNIHHKMEFNVLTKADKVVVISNSMREDFRKIKDRDYSVITNGYDTEDTASVSVLPEKKFTVSYIGSMAKSRNPESLWNAFADLKKSVTGFGNNLVIRLVGSVDFSVLESIERAGLKDNLEKVDYRPHNEIITLQNQSRLLLLIINDTPNAKVILPGKFFEYMASGRPILCIGPTDGDAAKIIKETRAGAVAEFNDQSSMIKLIKGFYEKYLMNDDTAITADISRFSRVSLTGNMAKELNSIILTFQ